MVFVKLRLKLVKNLKHTCAQPKRAPWEIQQWSAYHNERGPDGDVETLEFFAERVGACSRTREDVKTWFDYLDLDDHVTFGGKA